MDPQVRNFLAVVNNSRQPPIDQVPVEEARRQFSSLTPIFHPYAEVGRVTDSRSEATGVRFRSYYPDVAGGVPLPAIVYFHGGGWVLGDLETHDTLCRHLVNHSGCVVVSVDYRLAPEHRYPAALEDACEVVEHVARRAVELGVDAARLGFAGDSAGGNLAIGAAIHMRDQGGSTCRGLCLLYPVIDSRCDSGSYFDYAEDFGLTKARMQFFWRSYLGGDHTNDPGAAPVFADDLAHLAPSIVVTAEYDVLRDEGAEFARRLSDAGNAVDYECWEGVIHGFIHFAGAIERGQSALGSVGRRFGELLRRAG